MNRKYLFFAVGHGLIFAFLFSQSMAPESERFLFHPDDLASYEDGVEKGDYVISISKVHSSDLLEIQVESKLGWILYTWILIIGIVFGSSHYQTLMNQEKKEGECIKDDSEIISNQSPHEDPEYEAFLLEDSNRRLVPRPILEKEFEAWKLSKGASDDGSPDRFPGTTND